jgi:hypothetical protein
VRGEATSPAGRVQLALSVVSLMTIALPFRSDRQGRFKCAQSAGEQSNTSAGVRLRPVKIVIEVIQSIIITSAIP